MKRCTVYILFFALFLMACDRGDFLHYKRSAKYVYVYKYKSDEYFQYITSHEPPKKINYIYYTECPIVDSNEPLWVTWDCGEYGKNLVYRYNPSALDSLSFCDFLPNEIFRLEESFFIYVNSIFGRTEIDYGAQNNKIYNIKREDYCNGFDRDTLKCIEDSPYDAVFSIPIKDITDGIGKTAPAFKEIVEYINICISDSSIYNYEYK